jgi:hypothetical protein
MLSVQTTKPEKALNVTVFKHRATKTYGRVKKNSTHSRASHYTLAETLPSRVTHMDIKLGGRWSWAGHSGEEKTKMVHLEQYKLMASGNTDGAVKNCTDCTESLTWCRACELKGYSGLGMQQGCSAT